MQAVFYGLYRNIIYFLVTLSYTDKVYLRVFTAARFFAPLENDTRRGLCRKKKSYCRDFCRSYRKNTLQNASVYGTISM